MKAKNIFFISPTISDSGTMSPLNSSHLPGFEVRFQGFLRWTGVMGLFTVRRAGHTPVQCAFRGCAINPAKPKCVVRGASLRTCIVTQDETIYSIHYHELHLKSTATMKLFGLTLSGRSKGKRDITCEEKTGGAENLRSQSSDPPETQGSHVVNPPYYGLGRGPYFAAVLNLTSPFMVEGLS
jgi:hypothetical protein